MRAIKTHANIELIQFDHYRVRAISMGTHTNQIHHTHTRIHAIHACVIAPVLWWGRRVLVFRVYGCFYRPFQVQMPIRAWTNCISLDNSISLIEYDASCRLEFAPNMSATVWVMAALKYCIRANRATIVIPAHSDRYCSLGCAPRSLRASSIVWFRHDKQTCSTILESSRKRARAPAPAPSADMFREMRSSLHVYWYTCINVYYKMRQVGARAHAHLVFMTSMAT